jgi:iron complex transport system ATP-binding protein
MSESSRSTASWLLECVALRVDRGAREVLHDVSFSISSGECVSLIGPNGSGKTTLMLAMLGLLPPAAGRVRLDGVRMHRLSARKRGRFASYVPQVVDRIPAFTVYDVVAGGRFPHVSPLQPLTDADRAAIDAALAQSGLSGLASRRINAVSAGERQKALIAAAIAQDAQVMFLDEPSTALDPAVQIELVHMLKSWHRNGRALVLISHDLQLPAVLGGRVVALREGRVVADGSAEAVLNPDRLAEVYGSSFESAETATGRRIVVPSWWRELRAPGNAVSPPA